MVRLYNKHSHKALRRNLRQQMPKGEQLLWQELRNSKTGYKFRRQYSVDSYVLDFYCVQARLCIEVDGLSHQSEADALDDKKRDNWLATKGIFVKRYTSTDIFERIGDVVQDIIHVCERRVNH